MAAGGTRASSSRAAARWSRRSSNSCTRSGCRGNAAKHSTSAAVSAAFETGIGGTVMEMYVTPKARVAELVAAARARLVVCRDDDGGGSSWPSCVYVVTRDTG